MSEIFMQNAEPEIDCTCDNCGHQCKAGQLDMISDVQERLDPGCIVPAGQCPECGALSYYDDAKAPEFTAQRKLHDMEKAMEALRPKAGVA